MSIAFVLTTDDDIREVELPPPGGTRPAVCCEINARLLDVVRLTTRLDMWIDVEGHDVKPVNRVATALARRHGYTWQNYHGDVLLCGVNGDGDTIGLTREQTVGMLTHLLDVVT
ncbi:protein of unknown function [Sinosporangium album]|uniref:DUF3846 domain-containing protein n=1 Tax=Sinosporangium album TaxID=504805 RepID=A0A1G8EJT4_9ACTN|nr:DUF3846 domain-containing protein [Sinosporangium album]SDH70076.1 protein of unknown function [Sinosporangium album]